MRKETGSGKVAAATIDLDIIVVENVVVEADEKPLLVLPYRFPCIAIATERISERDDPF